MFSCSDPASLFRGYIWLPSILDLRQLSKDTIGLLKLDSDFLGAPETVGAIQNIRAGLRDILCAETIRRCFGAADREWGGADWALETTACTSLISISKNPNQKRNEKVPIPLTLHTTTRHLEKTIRAIPTHNLI
jgi:hypothetical protein